MNYQQKLSHLNALIKMANSDHIYSEIEHLFVQRIADKIGVDLKDLSSYDQKDLKLHLPGTEDEVIPLFHRLVLMIGMDEEITDEEKDFCFHLGVKMGLNPHAVSEVIGLIVRNGNEANPQLIIDIFNKYSN